MVNHPRGSRARHRSGRSLIRDRDRATPVNTPKLAPEKDKVRFLLLKLIDVYCTKDQCLSIRQVTSFCTVTKYCYTNDIC
jgi:hypothetical protein